MRCCWFILLLTTALVASDHVESKADPLPSARSVTSGKNGVLTHRLLRVHKNENDIDDEQDEERGVGTSTAETLANSLKSTGQLDDWLKKGESTDDVFKPLALDKTADDLLANPQLKEWISYVKNFNRENPKKQTTLIKTLTTHYGDEALAKIIEAAKQMPSTATIAKRLQSEQLQHWLSQGKSPDNVFRVLKLDAAGTEVFAQPQVVTWAKYVDDFNQANPDEKVTLFSTFAARFGDETLVQMLIAAKKVSSTEKIAEQVQAVQTKLWLSTGKAPIDVFELLQLNREGHDIFNSPLFNAWVRYTDDFRKINYGTQLTTIETLNNFYNDEILTKMIILAGQSSSTATMARRLETEQLRNWYIQGSSPKDVFKALNLYSSRLKVFENPLYNVWSKYAAYLGATEPSYKVSLATILTDVYGEGNLLKVLRTGTLEPSTKKMATELQDELLNIWLRADRDLAEIYHILRVDKTGAQDPNRLFFTKYLKAYAMA
ncbi:hypothetical protein PHYPSEUDO_010824 [Phytophthora pseudosyringae]|uniref:RxLR effector PexRD54 WY domain-containing protein n=1 Tax=Phytophthora pseudosyringae TaxID=221518 RepID=A0A8T1W7I9_9STRA|nr:hypothetical protein PHYPSEUDO_010824 [Phytophthora pseudosyringae]